MNRNWRKAAGANARRSGARAEKRVCQVLRRMGFACIKQIAIPRLDDGTRLAKVDGDIRCILPPHGISVTVEVKNRDGRMQWSWFDHKGKGNQLEDMLAITEAGGIALIAWEYNSKKTGTRLLMLDFDCVLQKMLGGCVSFSDVRHLALNQHTEINYAMVTDDRLGLDILMRKKRP